MADEEKKNVRLIDVKKFLQDGTDIENDEFHEFWMSLTDEEKEDFKSSLP